MTQSLYIPKENNSISSSAVVKTEDDVVKPLEEFKIDLNTESVSTKIAEIDQYFSFETKFVKPTL